MVHYTFVFKLYLPASSCNVDCSTGSAEAPWFAVDDEAGQATSDAVDIPLSVKRKFKF